MHSLRSHFWSLVALSWIAVSRSLDVIFTGIVTLAFSLSYENLVLGLRDLTSGESGVRVTAAKETFLGDDVPAYYVLLAVLGAYLIVFRLIQRSHIGWAFRAFRDDEVAAELAGINVARFRVYAGTIGSAMLGFVGGLYAHAEGFIGPSTFGFGHVDVRTLVMLAFGGIGSLLGPVLGAVVFTVLDEWLVNYSQPPADDLWPGDHRAVPRLPPWGDPRHPISVRTIPLSSTRSLPPR